ncbi:cysteine-rich receptor-like protein kinase 10 [Dorcoceras hygrometricum]|uniref:Cysteine-rich receptor-like protein kinase 10 n=1 Tax=Dorcoceras hygrometricum TaxID=472368 RepID=A0A2Z7BGN3_9LAMI|nr:cysteine-rich receptor-like protein kinase 10 [Dorcoceras hygrometricum]
MNQLERKEPAGTLNQQLTRSARAGSVMMTSAVMSSQSAGSYSRTSRWMIQTQEIKRRRTGRSIQSQATVHQQMIFEDSDSKTMSFGLMDTTAFCLRAKDSADGLCVGNNQQIATVVLNQLLQDSSRSVVVLEKESVDGITHMLKPAGAFIQMCSSRRVANDEAREHCTEKITQVNRFECCLDRVLRLSLFQPRVGCFTKLVDALFFFSLSCTSHLLWDFLFFFIFHNKPIYYSEFFWNNAKLWQCAYPARIFPCQLRPMKIDRVHPAFRFFHISIYGSPRARKTSL